MQPFRKHIGIAVPLDRVNVDTDAIIPKQFLRKIDRVGFGKHLFHELRYTDYEGTKENPQFVLNQERYRKASVLLARDNFGCGSSREHAPWAIEDYGFKVIIAPSFADIFYNNCFKNGILPVKLSSNEVDELFADVSKEEGAKVITNLEMQKVSGPTGKEYSFEIDPFGKKCLLQGLDSIGWTEQFSDIITEYEAARKKTKPWLFTSKLNKG